MTDSLYADGGVVRINPSPIGGTWAWCLVQNGEITLSDSGVILPGDAGGAVSNNVSELYALVNGLLAMPPRWHGDVYSDSHVTLLRVFQAGRLRGVPVSLTKRLQRAQRHCNIEACNPILLSGHPTRKELAAGVSKKGRPVSAWNAWCDKECTRLAKKMFAEVTQ